MFDPNVKVAGVLAPLFALRGTHDLGVGDLGALREFLEWAREQGFRVVQLLPINETGSDNSPYNAISSVALEPSTIETTPDALGDLTPEDYAEVMDGVELEALRAGAVAYSIVKPLKLALLRKAFARFLATSWKKNDARAQRFRTFTRTEESWLEGYALFRVLMDENEGSDRWDRWPEEQRTVAGARQWVAEQSMQRRRELTHAVRFTMWVQWVAFAQWRRLRVEAERLGVALMGDLPFGVSYFSADVWSQPELFDHRWCGGAPPEPLFSDDPFTKKWGQNWGVPLYCWAEMRRRDFDWWRQRVSKIREIFRFFRVDHILGFYRIYAFPWRPGRNAEFVGRTRHEAAVATGGDLPRFHPRDDATPENKAANCAEGEALLRLLVAACGLHTLIGEDLGTVPDYVRPSLLNLGIAGFRVPFWEQEWDTHLTPGERYDRLSIATFATHDHDPLRALWERWMSLIEAALIEPERLASVRDATWWEVRRLAAWAGFEVPRITHFEDVHEPLLGALFRTNSWMAICLITDLFGTSQRFNVPGAVSASNWSARLAEPIAQWRTDSAFAAKMIRLRELLAESGRLNSPTLTPNS